MSLAERLEQMEPRERQLLNILLIVFLVFLLLLVPLGVTWLVGSKRSNVKGMRDAIAQIQEQRPKLVQRERERQAIRTRYTRKAPALAGFLEQKAKSAGFEIPESQDRPEIPRGKFYDERSTKIRLSKIDMLKLLKFTESIKQSGYPLSISKINIRKRGIEQDSYDVEMYVSAFDRKEKPKKTTKKDEEE